MENIQISLDVVGPLFLMMALGYGLRQSTMLDEHTISNCNKMVFRLFLPLMLFKNMYEADFSAGLDPVLVLLCGGGLTFVYIISYLIMPVFTKEPKQRGVMVQGICRSNSSMFGVAVSLALFGNGNIGVVVSMLAVAVLLTNLYSVLALELSWGGKPQWKKIGKSLATNCIVLFILAGLLFNLIGLKLPKIVLSAVNSLGSVATPLSFLTLGASFTFAGARKNRKLLTVAVMGRLIIIPLIFVSAAALLGFRGQSLLAALIVFAPPTAVSSFPMTQAMGGDAELADGIVVFTSIISVVTIFLWILALKSLGLL